MKGRVGGKEWSGSGVAVDAWPVVDQVCLVWPVSEAGIKKKGRGNGPNLYNT